MYAGASFRAWLGYSGRRVGCGGPDRFHELRGRRPRGRRRDGGLARGGRACRPPRRAALRLRRGRRLVAADPRRRLRGRLRPGRGRAPQGLGLDRRRRFDGEPLLLDAEHDPRRGAGAPAAVRPARASAAVSSSARISRRPSRTRTGARRCRPSSKVGATRVAAEAVREARGRRPRGRGPSPPTRRASRARARAPSTPPGEASTSSTAAAIASGSFGSKRRAASPTTSGSEPTSEHATGQPQAIASSGGWPKPS